MNESQKHLSLEEGIELCNELERGGLMPLAALMNKWIEQVASGHKGWSPKVQQKLTERVGGASLEDKISKTLLSLDRQFVALDDDDSVEAIDTFIRERFNEIVQLLSSDGMPATIRNPIKDVVEPNEVGGDRGQFVAHRMTDGFTQWEPNAGRRVINCLGRAFALPRVIDEESGDTKRRDKKLELCHSGKAPEEGDDGVVQGELAQALELIMSKSKTELVDSGELTAENLRQLSDKLHAAAVTATVKELDGDAPSPAGANWYIKGYKAPSIDGEDRDEIASRLKNVRQKGLTMLFNDQPCVVGTVPLKAQNTRRFRVREAGSSQRILTSPLSLPAELRFM